MRRELWGLSVSLAVVFFGCGEDRLVRSENAVPSKDGSGGDRGATGGAAVVGSSGGSRSGGSGGAGGSIGVAGKPAPGGAAGIPASGGATDASVDAGTGGDADASDAATTDATPGDAQVYGKPMHCVSGLPPDMARLDTTIGLVPAPGTMSALVSRDGTTVTGAVVADPRAHLGHWYRWSGNDFADLGVVGPLVNGAPTAIDCTGDTIAGHMFTYAPDPAPQGVAHALRWKKGEGFHELAPTYAADPSSQASVNAITADGEVILGIRGGVQLTRWIGNGAPEPVNTGGVFDDPNVVSFDAEGRVLLGRDGGLATLLRSGQPVVHITEANARNTSPAVISAGGDYVAGVLSPTTGSAKGYVWNAATGIVQMGVYLIPKAVSADGAVVVGVAPPGAPFEPAFIWDKAHGARSFDSVLAAYNLHLPAGFRIFDLTGVSDDGRVVVGESIDSSGNQAAFRAVLPKAAIE